MDVMIHRMALRRRVSDGFLGWLNRPGFGDESARLARATIRFEWRGSQLARRLRRSAGAVPVVRSFFSTARPEPPQPTIRLDENRRRNPHPIVIAVAHRAQPEIFSLDVAK